MLPVLAGTGREVVVGYLGTIVDAALHYRLEVPLALLELLCGLLVQGVFRVGVLHRGNSSNDHSSSTGTAAPTAA